MLPEETMRIPETLGLPGQVLYYWIPGSATYIIA